MSPRFPSAPSSRFVEAVAAALARHSVAYRDSNVEVLECGDGSDGDHRVEIRVPFPCASDALRDGAAIAQDIHRDVALGFRPRSVRITFFP